jgi:hypothetical protein
MCWGLGVRIRPGALVGEMFGLGAVRLWWVVIVFVGVYVFVMALAVKVVDIGGFVSIVVRWL